ncbi:MAG: hypothetical protein ACP5HG_02690 [Anaerolineae bacterium]
MDELVKSVQSKVGLDEESAQRAVKTVVDYLKEKLATPVATQIDTLLSNEELLGDVSDALQTGAENVGGFLSRSQEKGE